jgi:hypothetical protein
LTEKKIGATTRFEEGTLLFWPPTLITILLSGGAGKAVATGRSKK